MKARPSVAQILIPVALGSVMLGLGLSLTPADFKRAISRAKPVIIGLLGQMVLLPLLSLCVIKIFNVEPIFAIGMMILALCPGGVLSNMVSHLARADLALSVTLTAVVSLVSPFTIPPLTNWLTGMLGANIEQIVLPLGRTMGQLLGMAVVPVLIGMAIRKASPKVADKADRPVRIIAGLLMAGVVFGVMKQNWTIISGGFATIGPPALLLNLTCMALGYYAARILRVHPLQAATISIEVGMQNAGVATFITGTLLGRSELLVPVAIYASVQVPVALLFALLVNRTLGRPAADQKDKAEAMTQSGD